ncbi:hypothetical protein ACNKHX_13095 [Shigella flexneri]
MDLALALAAEGAKVGTTWICTAHQFPPCWGAEDQRPTSQDGTHMARLCIMAAATDSIGYIGH